LPVLRDLGTGAFLSQMSEVADMYGGVIKGKRVRLRPVRSKLKRQKNLRTFLLGELRTRFFQARKRNLGTGKGINLLSIGHGRLREAYRLMGGGIRKTQPRGIHNGEERKWGD